jgi:Fe-S-cluster-containing hydrogenase component 2
MSEGFNKNGGHFAEVTVQEKCIGCLQCALICPDAAIEIDRETTPESHPEESEKEDV